MKAFSVCLVFIFIACSSGPVPNGIIAPDKMQKVVKDMVQVDEYINSFLSKDTTLDIKKKRSTLYEQVFLLHQTNRKQFYTSFKYYQQHPNLQKRVFDSIYNDLNKEKNDTNLHRRIKAIAAK